MECVVEPIRGDLIRLGGTRLRLPQFQDQSFSWTKHREGSNIARLRVEDREEKDERDREQREAVKMIEEHLSREEPRRRTKKEGRR